MDKGRTPGPLALESSTLAPADTPVVERLKKVVEYVSKMVPSGAKGSAIVRRMAMELLNDVSEYPPEFVEFYLKQFSALMYWTAMGETIDDVPLPEDFKGE